MSRAVLLLQFFASPDPGKLAFVRGRAVPGTRGRAGPGSAPLLGVLLLPAPPCQSPAAPPTASPGWLDRCRPSPPYLFL